MEKHFEDVQDIEFTVQEGKLFMLETRNGKRTAMAALKFSMDMVKEKLIDWETAILRNPADQLGQLLAPFRFARSEAGESHRDGSARRSGAATGQIYFNADRAVQPPKGEKVLLVRVETSPEDLRGMIAAEGILTARGGVSSHAALVARQMGKVCVCGASALHVDYDKRILTIEGQSFKGRCFRLVGLPEQFTPVKSKPRRLKSLPGLINDDKAAQARKNSRASRN